LVIGHFLLLSAAVQAGVPRSAYPLYGRSVEIDPTFGRYWRDRSPASIASEIRANGYRIVRCIATVDSNIDRALVDALHEEGIGVWYSTFGNGTYSRKDLPRDWESWRMVTRSDLAGRPLRDGYTRLCLNNSAYRAWKKARIIKTLKAFPFQGVDIMEPHWPECPGPESPAYACFCEACRAAFKKRFPARHELPDILDPGSPRSPASDPGLWRDWLAFRQASLTGFLDDLVNGPGGIRAGAPGVRVCTWTLALADPDGPRRVREDSGEDAAEIARVVRPDLHCLQTHWPDWLRADLPPDYVRQYRPFVEPIRAAAPNLPLMIQADVGSKPENRRSWSWIHAFEEGCAAVGVDNTTFYEYTLGEYIYTDPPRVAETRPGAGGVELHFTRRLDAASAQDKAHYAVSPGRVGAIRVDGSIVRLTLEEVRPGESCVLTVTGLRDDPERRLFKDRPAAVGESQTVRFETGGVPVTASSPATH